MSNSAIFKTKCRSKSEFFVLWLTLLNPFISIRKKELQVLAKIVETRYDISKVTQDTVQIELELFSTEKRKKMRDSLGMDELNFNNILCVLRKKKLILKDKINIKLIPNIDSSINSFTLTYDINIDEFK